MGSQEGCFYLVLCVFFWDEEKDKISKCIVEKPKMVPTLTSKLGGFNLQIEEEKIF